MPGMRGTGYHLHGAFFGAGVFAPNLTVSVNTTLGGFSSTDGNNSYYDFIVNAGVTLALEGCPIYVGGTLTLKNGCLVSAFGNNASGPVGGAATGSFKLQGGLAGGSDPGAGTHVGVVGATGSSIGAYNIGGAGGNGGAAGLFLGGNGGIESFGSGTSVGLKDELLVNFQPMYSRLFNSGVVGTSDGAGPKFPLIQGMCGGAGGGSGASNDAGSRGGGGGSGGGMLWIAADTIVFEENVVIAVNGGSGGNASGVANASGGGGGGGGGIVLFYHELVLPTINGPRLLIDGGVGGALLAGGINGVTGANGRIVLFDLGSGTAAQFNTNITM